MTELFINPYNFIPAPARPSAGPLADGPPAPHARYLPDRWSGRIRVEMRVVTPLLAPYAVAEPWPNEPMHKVYRTRTDARGDPLIAPTSIKGMLRAAFEAVTNSRFGVFEAHDGALGYRQGTDFAADLVPARIEGDRLTLLMGLQSDFSTSRGPLAVRGPNRPVLLDRWRKRQGGRSAEALVYPDGRLPAHGEEVFATIGNRPNEPPFRKFVLAIRPAKGTPRPQERRAWVYVTNQNAEMKRYERVFVETRGPPKIVNLPRDWPKLRRQWNDLIGDYRTIHRGDLEKRTEQLGGDPEAAYEQYLGGEPRMTAWSRHVYDHEAFPLFPASPDGGLGPAARPFLCYARVEIENRTECRVTGLYPVQIPRDVWPVAPAKLVDPSLLPAESLEQLSPADRLFGWVARKKSQEDVVAYRGNLRVGRVRLEEAASGGWRRAFEPPLPLAILGAPRPSQWRFYVARDRSGCAFPEDPAEQRRAEGYSQGRGLRGRKVYLHHRDLEPGHWEPRPPDAAVPAEGPWQEYRRQHRPPEEEPEDIRDDQNRSISDWINPGCVFGFDLRVTNLSDVELGALLWLLDLNALEEVATGTTRYHRLGGGKPLGFGSVTLRVRQLDLERGTARCERYCSLGTVKPPPDGVIRADGVKHHAVAKLVNKFKAATRQALADTPGLAAAYGLEAEPRFEQVPWIRAFLRTAEGFAGGLAVHYPRASEQPGHYPPPKAKGENFKWFVANAQDARPQVLPDLAADEVPALRLVAERKAARAGGAGERRGGPSRPPPRGR